MCRPCFQSTKCKSSSSFGSMDVCVCVWKCLLWNAQTLLLKASVPPPVILLVDQTSSCLSKRECRHAEVFFLMPHLQSNKPLRPSEAPSLNLKYSNLVIFFSNVTDCQPPPPPPVLLFTLQEKVTGCRLYKADPNCGVYKSNHRGISSVVGYCGSTRRSLDVFYLFILRGRYRIWHQIINAFCGSLNKPACLFFSIYAFSQTIVGWFLQQDNSSSAVTAKLIVKY